MEPKWVTGLLSTSETCRFYKEFENVVNRINNLHVNTFGSGVMKGEIDWAKFVLDANVTDKLSHISGSLVSAAFKAFIKPNTKEIKQGCEHVCGWSIEIMNASHCMVHDIINNNKQRNTYGLQSSWYMQPEVGLSAINDSFMLQMNAYHISQLFLAPENPGMANKLCDAMLTTKIFWGSGVAFEEEVTKDFDLNRAYNLTNYREIVKHKFSYPTLVAPVLCALIIAGLDEDYDLKKNLTDIMVNIGYLIKLRMEYAEIFMKEKVRESQSTKLSWFFVKAIESLQISEEKSEIDVLKPGSATNNIEGIRNIYERLELPSKYEQEERRLYKLIVEKAYSVKNQIDNAFFINVVDSYKLPNSA